MSDALKVYFEALERLKRGHPTIVLKGSKINNDTVALEAGRGKGSIKKSRDVFANLIISIDEAEAEQSKPNNEQTVRLSKEKNTSDQLRIELEAAFAREMSLLLELYESKKKAAQLTGGKILPIRGDKSSAQGLNVL